MKHCPALSDVFSKILRQCPVREEKRGKEKSQEGALANAHACREATCRHVFCRNPWSFCFVQADKPKGEKDEKDEKEKVDKVEKPEKPEKDDKPPETRESAPEEQKEQKPDAGKVRWIHSLRILVC